LKLLVPIIPGVNDEVVDVRNRIVPILKKIILITKVLNVVFVITVIMFIELYVYIFVASFKKNKIGVKI